MEHKAITISSPVKVVDELFEYVEKTGINKCDPWLNIGGQPHGPELVPLELFSAQVLPQPYDVRYNWASLAARPMVATEG